MIPNSFLEIADSIIRKDYYKKYFNDQYPDSEDCIVLDKQTRDIQIDILKIIEHKEPTFPIVKEPCIKNTWSSNCINGYKTVVNPEYQKAITTRLLSKSFLDFLINEKRNKQIKLDCRNKFETLRQEETAQVFTESSEKAEKRVLGDTRKKQYFLAIIGMSVMLTALTIFLIKKNK